MTEVFPAGIQEPQALCSKLALGAEDELNHVLRRKQQTPALAYSKASLPLRGSSAQSRLTAGTWHRVLTFSGLLLAAAIWLMGRADVLLAKMQ